MDTYNRHYTCELLELIDEGALDLETTLECCLEWMSEQQVKEMMTTNLITRELIES